MRKVYERQIIADGWGEEGQRKLLNSTVAVAGVGGLGSLITYYLTAAGIGRLLLWDPDQVSESNLNRQILYTLEDLGKKKVEAARERLTKLNPDVKIEIFSEKINEKNIEMLKGADAIVDALDNMETRMLLNRFAVKNGIPLFHGAIYGWEGRVTTILPDGPCLACLYGASPTAPSGTIPSIGAVVGLVASIQVQEVLKYLLGYGKLLSGKLMIWDGKNGKMIEISYSKNPGCPVCGGEK